MTTETIVAVYDTPAHAELAIADLEASGIPTQSIQHYSSDRYSNKTYDPAQDTGGKSEGLWAWLTGDDTSQTHHAKYDESFKAGSTVVTVVTDTSQAAHVVSVLEQHSPINLEEQDATGVSHTAGYSATTAASVTGARDTATGTEEVIPLAEETLRVGKREIDQGTTQVRRYVVERPVEEQVRLRDEKVSVFRRPATEGSVGVGAFTDKTITMTETTEEAVVAKSARVVEEVVVQKGFEERTETVRDSVRKEEVEITGPHDNLSSNQDRSRVA